MGDLSESVESHLLTRGESVPNNPDLPLLLYSGVLTNGGTITPSGIESTYLDNQWGGTWRNGIYSYHHFHTTAHEVLGVASGRATVIFGGPNGITVELTKGDVAVLPAGTGHKNDGSSPDLLVVGGYPVNQANWDLKREGDVDVEAAIDVIKSVPRPAADPVFGQEGPLMEKWGRPSDQSTPDS